MNTQANKLNNKLTSHSRGVIIFNSIVVSLLLLGHFLKAPIFIWLIAGFYLILGVLAIFGTISTMLLVRSNKDLSHLDDTFKEVGKTCDILYTPVVMAMGGLIVCTLAFVGCWQVAVLHALGISSAYALRAYCYSVGRPF